MARRLILDTGVLVSIERGAFRLAQHIQPTDDLVISTITVSELRAGIALSSSTHRPAREQFLARILATIPVEPFRMEFAVPHAELLAFTKRSGQPRGAHDLIIAATAIGTDRILLTGDHKARFHDLPGLMSATVNNHYTLNCDEP